MPPATRDPNPHKPVPSRKEPPSYELLLRNIDATFVEDLRTGEYLCLCGALQYPQVKLVRGNDPANKPTHYTMFCRNCGKDEGLISVDHGAG